MKRLLLLAMLVAATVMCGVRADYTDGVYDTIKDLNNTNVCVNGVFNHSRLETNVSGLAYNAIGCTVPENSFVNISGGKLPVLFLNVQPIPVGLAFNQNTVGAGSALVVHGPQSQYGRMMMAWFVEIIGNTFQRNAQLRILGSFPINSTVTVEGNTFDIKNVNPYLTDTLDTLMAISFGGNLTDFFEPISLYRDAHFRIRQNTINVDAVSAAQVGMGMSILSDIYFTDDCSVEITDNTVTASCHETQECYGFHTASYLTLLETYSNSYARLDRNKFTILNGRGFVVPLVWSPAASFYLSASRNTIGITLEEAARSIVSEHAITFDDTAAGMSTKIEVCFNVITAVGNSLLYFQGANDFTGDAIFNCSWNEMFTTTGDPSVYFVDQTSVIDHATFNIDNNLFQRQDDQTVKRPYLSLTYDLSILGTAEFSFRNNECYPKNIASGPRMVVLTAGRVINVGPTAYFAICGNVYNGNPSDLIIRTVTDYNVYSLINCMARTTATVATTTEEPSATPAPSSTTTAPPTKNAATPVGGLIAAAVAACVAALLV